MGKRRGEVDDFMWVLAIALILIIAVGAFSYFVPYTGPLTNISLTTFAPGEVGYVEDFVARSVDLRTFNVGEEQAELLRAFPQLELSRGLLGGNTEEFGISVPEYHMETQRRVAINFNVYDTNSYGDLVIEWNGREVLSDRLSRGSHELVIPAEHVKASNTLRAYTTGPGLMFWASSVYILKNFNVELSYGPHRTIPFELLPSEMDGFDRVQLTGYASGTGALEIKINGVQVYRDSPTGMLDLEFDVLDAPIRAGQNLLTFIDQTGVYTIRDSVFRIYTRGDQAVASRRFNLTDEHYGFLVNSIFQGRVEYLIESIPKQGGVEIAMNGDPIPTSPPRVGWNSATFTSESVRMGENIVTISGTGHFNIPELRVELER